MRRWFSFITLLVNCVLAVNLVATSQESAESLDRKRRLAYHADESRIDELVSRFSASRGDALSSTVGFAAAQLLDDAIVRDGVADHVWRRTVREK